jgi:magnesium chelatase family protein
VRGQVLARRALEVAAAGGHHLPLVGSPGAGKTLLATRLPGLLPDLDPTTAREVARLRSVAAEDGETPRRDLRPPFRAPHHGLSAVAMIGGGRSALHPGEIDLIRTNMWECSPTERAPTGTSGCVENVPDSTCARPMRR